LEAVQATAPCTPIPCDDPLFAYSLVDGLCRSEFLIFGSEELSNRKQAIQYILKTCVATENTGDSVHPAHLVNP
jgi:hypothetical protein